MASNNTPVFFSDTMMCPECSRSDYDKTSEAVVCTSLEVIPKKYAALAVELPKGTRSQTGYEEVL